MDVNQLSAGVNACQSLVDHVVEWTTRAPTRGLHQVLSQLMCNGWNAASIRFDIVYHVGIRIEVRASSPVSVFVSVSDKLPSHSQCLEHFNKCEVRVHDSKYCSLRTQFPDRALLMPLLRAVNEAHIQGRSVTRFPMCALGWRLVPTVVQLPC